jgi:hypothetical protein
LYRTTSGCASVSHIDCLLHNGFDALGAEVGMQHITYLVLLERSHLHAASCDADVGCDDHNAPHYSGKSAAEDEVTGSAVAGSTSKRGLGSSPGTTTSAPSESDKKRLKRENSGSQTPVQQPCKSATTPASTDKKGLRSLTHRTHLSEFDQTALPSPSLSYQRNYRTTSGCASVSHIDHLLHNGFDALGAEGGMQHITDLVLLERSHLHAASCDADVGCDDHNAPHYSGKSAAEDEVTGSAVAGSTSKRGLGSSPGTTTSAPSESDKKRLKRENSGSQTPVQQPCKSATTPASTDKKGLRSFSGQV